MTVQGLGHSHFEVMIAVVGKYMLPYGWDWPTSMLFGSILSATDPVAVVAIFNSLGLPKQEVVVTFVCAYMSFFIAENEMQSSGVLTLVTTGYVVASFAWPRFIDRETVHTIWHMIEFVGNTIIFILAGLMFGGSLMRVSACLFATGSPPRIWVPARCHWLGTFQFFSVHSSAASVENYFVPCNAPLVSIVFSKK
eukprot:1194852-Amphidinium_carterae.1